MARIWIMLAATVALATAARADIPPQPPCAGEAVPTWPTSEATPAVVVLHADDLPAHWEPAACAGLSPPSGATFVAVAGRFRYQGDASSLLARVGAISRQRDIVYWSVSHLGWRPLLVDASALSGPDPEQRRADFTADELHAGARLYTIYDDEDEPGPVVFDTEIREAGPDGFVTTLVNVTAMRIMGISIADPGYLSGMTSVHRVGDDLWDYYALNAVRLAPLAAAMLPDASFINRAVASYRYLAGIPGDRDPPAALK